MLLRSVECERTVTSVQNVSEATNEAPSYTRIYLSEIRKPLRRYLVVPVTSATSEKTFSVLRRLLVYLRSTTTEMLLNNCLLLHVHKLRHSRHHEHGRHCKKKMCYSQTQPLWLFSHHRKKKNTCNQVLRGF